MKIIILLLLVISCSHQQYMDGFPYTVYIHGGKLPQYLEHVNIRCPQGYYILDQSIDPEYASNTVIKEMDYICSDNIKKMLDKRRLPYKQVFIYKGETDEYMKTMRKQCKGKDFQVIDKVEGDYEDSYLSMSYFCK